MESNITAGQLDPLFTAKLGLLMEDRIKYGLDQVIQYVSMLQLVQTLLYIPVRFRDIGYDCVTRLDFRWEKI